MNAQPSFVNLSDSDLLITLKRLVESERNATAAVVAAVAEVEARRLFLGEGCPSLFAYCTRVLHFSEPAAYARIAAARAGLRFLDSGDEPQENISVDPCPRCGGAQFEPFTRGRRWAALTWLVVGVPLARIHRTLRCRQCGATVEAVGAWQAIGSGDGTGA